MANRGKNICKTLKEIRQKVAEENDIPLKEHECPYVGDCNGTCPYCDAELRYIEGELEKRKAEGKRCSIMWIAVPTKKSTKEDFVKDTSEFENIDDYEGIGGAIVADGNPINFTKLISKPGAEKVKVIRVEKISDIGGADLFF